MPTADFNTFDDSELYFAIARGLDFTIEASATVAGISLPTGNRWLKEDNVKRLISITKTVAAQRVEKVGAEVARTARERMAWVFDESFKLTELLIKKAMLRGDGISVEELMDIHKNITTWAARYNVSEAPKRLESYNERTTTHVHILSFAEAANVLQTRQMIAAAQPTLPVIDVEPNDGTAN